MWGVCVRGKVVRAPLSSSPAPHAAPSCNSPSSSSIPTLRSTALRLATLSGNTGLSMWSTPWGPLAPAFFPSRRAAPRVSGRAACPPSRGLLVPSFQPRPSAACGRTDPVGWRRRRQYGRMRRGAGPTLSTTGGPRDHRPPVTPAHAEKNNAVLPPPSTGSTNMCRSHVPLP